MQLKLKYIYMYVYQEIWMKARDPKSVVRWARKENKLKLHVVSMLNHQVS